MLQSVCGLQVVDGFVFPLLVSGRKQWVEWLVGEARVWGSYFTVQDFADCLRWGNPVFLIQLLHHAAPVDMDRCSKDCNGRNQCEEAIWETYVNAHKAPCMQFSMHSYSILYGIWFAIHCSLLQFVLALRMFVIHCGHKNDVFWIFCGVCGSKATAGHLLPSLTDQCRPWKKHEYKK